MGDVSKVPYYGTGYLSDMYYGEFDGSGDFIPDMFIGGSQFQILCRQNSCEQDPSV
jgi:hypothetical protein